MSSLLARTWRGATHAADADTYLAYLRATGLAEYAATPGNRGVLALRRVDGEHAEWLLVTFWDSPAAVRAFVGAPSGPSGDAADASDDAALTRAVFYPEDDRFLTARDARAAHYEVVHAALPPAAPAAPGDRAPGGGEVDAGATP